MRVYIRRPSGVARCYELHTARRRGPIPPIGLYMTMPALKKWFGFAPPKGLNLLEDRWYECRLEKGVLRLA